MCHNTEQPGSHFAYFFRGGLITISLDGADVAKTDGKPPNTTFQFQRRLCLIAALDSDERYIAVTGASSTLDVDQLTCPGERQDGRDCVRSRSRPTLQFLTTVTLP
ncbi:hypothetical protein FRC08_017261 [Ceratobasidium sp. 394]|nr:hypothetical protein FRC08_017261 [Ceratobasidium sp. 394]